MDLALIPKNLKNLDEWIPNDIEERKKCNVFLCLPMSYINTKKLEKLEQIFKPYQGLKRLVFIFEPKDYKITEQEINTLLDFQLERPIDISIQDKYDAFSLAKSYVAMNKIYAYDKFIEENNLSPLETLMYAYFVATQKPYKAENEKKESEEISRSLYSVMLQNKIVCAGYCNVIKGIVNNSYNANNIMLFDNTTISYEKKEKLLHATLIVYLKDPKYGLNGYYFLDPTVDAEIENVADIKDRNWLLNNFLISLNDIKNSNFDYKEVKLFDIYASDLNEMYDQEFKKERFDTSVRFGDEKLIINKEFQKSLNDNIKILDELSKNYGSQITGVPLSKTITKNPRIVEQALYNNSEPVSLDVLIRSMYRVFDAMKIYPTKQENFYYTKKIVNKNILCCEAGLNFKKGASQAWHIAEEIYKV